MKCTKFTCDICGKDITNDDVKYKFKEYENSYVNYEDFEFQKWTKLDMCEECYKKFCKFVKENNDEHKEI